MTAPQYRSVDALSGEVSMAAAYQLLQADRDALVEKVQEAQAQRDNMVNLTLEVGLLGAFLKDALAENDSLTGDVEEWRERAERAEARVEELEQP